MFWNGQSVGMMFRGPFQVTFLSRLLAWALMQIEDGARKDNVSAPNNDLWYFSAVDLIAEDSCKFWDILPYVPKNCILVCAYTFWLSSKLSFTWLRRDCERWDAFHTVVSEWVIVDKHCKAFGRLGDAKDRGWSLRLRRVFRRNWYCCWQVARRRYLPPDWALSYSASRWRWPNDIFDTPDDADGVKLHVAVGNRTCIQCLLDAG